MTGFLPKIVASEPVHGRKAVAARLYELMTHIKSFPCKSETMVGNAVDTMSYVEEYISELARMRHAEVYGGNPYRVQGANKQGEADCKEDKPEGSPTFRCRYSRSDRFIAVALLEFSVGGKCSHIVGVTLLIRHYSWNLGEFREGWSRLYRSWRNPSAAGLLAAGGTRIPRRDVNTSQIPMRICARASSGRSGKGIGWPMLLRAANL